jgi:predicted ABC-type ATPase
LGLLPEAMSPATRPNATITVLAGVNGSGKSSILGELLVQHGGTYFNPDAFTRQLMKLDPLLPLEVANGKAWNYGKVKLVEAISSPVDYAFETTLGAKTIASLLEVAAGDGLSVRMLYCGLESAELNVRRVAARVSRGGHDIPIEKILQRWESSRANLIKLLHLLNELKVYDNSIEATEANKFAPSPKLLVHMKKGKIISLAAKIPEWAKGIVTKAILTHEQC